MSEVWEWSKTKLRQRSHRLVDKIKVFYTFDAGSNPAGIATSQLEAGC